MPRLIEHDIAVAEVLAQSRPNITMARSSSPGAPSPPAAGSGGLAERLQEIADLDLIAGLDDAGERNRASMRSIVSSAVTDPP